MSTCEATPAADRPDMVEESLLRTLDPLDLRGKVWMGSLSVVALAGLGAYAYQLVNGLRVTAMRDYVSWGLYITTFVFFVGISHAGTFISAVLRVTHAGWRRPVTRMAEAITVVALLVAASMVIVDIGRPDRLLNLVFFGRMQSPILWDVVCIFTYLSGSTLYLYTAMLPDLPLLARRASERGSPRLARLYWALSLGYAGSPEQRRRLERGIGAMAVIIIPVMVSVHTVVSWIFGMTIRPGWHSTIFGSYFVIGAIYSGVAAVITAMAAFRWVYRLQPFLTPRHFRNLAALLLAIGLLYAYFTLGEYLTMWYGGLEPERRLLQHLMISAPYGPAFWLWVVLGLFLPLGLLVFPGRRSVASIVSASVLVNLGMWLKRYLIVVPTLQTPEISADTAGVVPAYFPTAIEWTITLGALAGFLLLFTLFSRFFPILSVWETKEELEAASEPGADGSRRPWRPIGVLTVLVGLALVAHAAPVQAQDHASHAAVAVAPESTAAPAKAASVAVALTEEDGKKMLVATVLADGRPVQGARVAFFVQRRFGKMTLGEDVTLEDGTAAVDFPVGLPGDGTGALRVSADVVEPAQLVGSTGSAVVHGGALPAKQAVAEPRALWAARAPLALIAAVVTLLLTVWGTYTFVVVQLLHIRRLGERS